MSRYIFYPPPLPSPPLSQGGETEALRRLEASFADPKWVATFKKPDTDPAAFERPATTGATTVLSPYLKFGCLSARLFHSRLLAVYRQHRGHSEPPVSLRGQLLWREFFYTVRRRGFSGGLGQEGVGVGDGKERTVAGKPSTWVCFLSTEPREGNDVNAEATRVPKRCSRRTRAYWRDEV